ncbi:hypothetical protein Emed_006928 [Eimeria media]
MEGCPNLAGKDLMSAAKSLFLHNKVQMPLLGLGTWRLRGEKLKAGVWSALQEGYGLIDTAAVYGNEEEIRDLVKEAGSSGVGVDSPKNRRLRLESWRALEQLYEQKKVRAIGVSNFMISHIQELMEDGANVMPMLEWHPMCWIPEMIPFAKKHNIILQAYSSLGSGEDRLLEHPVVKQIAKEINQPPAVVLLRWPLQQGLMVIPCSTSREHLRENAAALECELTEDQMKRLCSIRDTTQHRFCWDPNTIS